MAAKNQPLASQHQQSSEDESRRLKSINAQKSVMSESSGAISYMPQPLANPQNHESKLSHRQVMDNPQIRSCVSLKDRFTHSMYNLLCCKNSENSYVDELDSLERNHPITLTEQIVDTLLRSNIVELAVLESSRLELDPNVIHPFVKIHLVDKNTGCYLKKRSNVETAVYHNEACGYFDTERKKYQACDNDLVLPFSTNCSDFRKEGNSRGCWNQKFFINDEADNLLTPNTVILFEILDYNHKLLTEMNIGDLGADNMYRIAWGFIRPVGLSKRHFGTSKIQLYRYKFNDRKLPNQINKSYIPTVYYDFIWPGHEKYEGYLSVRITPLKAPHYEHTENLMPPENLFMVQRPEKEYIEKYTKALPSSRQQETLKQDRLLKYYRIVDCLIPEKLLGKFESDVKGCLRLAMSDYLLFCGVTANGFSPIKVYSLQSLTHVMTLKGHMELIYDLRVSNDQKLLLSVGSDMVARLWQIPQMTGEFIDEEESERQIIAQCIHPSFIYCSAILEGRLQSNVFFLTGCYDGYVRLWVIDISTREMVDCIDEPLSKEKNSNIYPTAITAGDGYFVVGDSIGTLHIYEVSIGEKRGPKIIKRNTIEDKQFEGDMIRAIHLLNKTDMIVQSKDNVIRKISVAGGRAKHLQNYVGAQSQHYPIRSALSPDKKFLLSGSDEGSVVMWSVDRGESINISHLQLKIHGPVVDCIWSKKYNIVAMCGFVPQCPIFVYGNIGKEHEQQAILALIEQQKQKS